MKLYLLRPLKVWQPWYDKCFGMVIRANSEEEARKEASNHSGDEDSKSYDGGGFYDDDIGDDIDVVVNVSVWQNNQLTSCEELTNDGDPGLVIKDFAAA